MGVVRNDNPEIIMSKSRTSPLVGRLSPRRIWSPRSKSQTRNPQPTWTPLKGCSWQSRSGQQVTLTDAHLTSLTEAERMALRQVALAKVQALNLGCHITLPKERSVDNKPKKRPILLKKRAVTTGFFAEKLKAEKDVADRAARGMVFGVPLAACVHHERQRASGMASRSKSTSVEELVRNSIPRSSSRTSFTLLLDPRDDKRLLSRQDALSYESLDLEPNRKRSLIGLADAFGLRDPYAETDRSEPQVPDIISACLRHIESYGMHTLGIFRVSSSRKRIRQLREEFDSGLPVDLGSQYCPHDVATLLKEYFRDLPEPLLTRELYPAYVATQKIRNRKHQLPALRYLAQLLPIPNSDTLWTLLQFLSKVAKNSSDHRSASGEWMAGNKMDSNNLATLFGPNILHTVKNTTGGEREFVVLTAARAEERIDVINAVRCMIESYQEIYQVPADYLNEAYMYLYEKDPGLVEYLMNCRQSLSEIDADFDTSTSLPEGLDLGTFLSSRNESDVSVQNGRGRAQQEAKIVNKEDADSSGSSKNEGSMASRLFRRRDKSSSRSQNSSPTSSTSSQNRKRENNDEGGSAPVRWFRRRERSSTKNLDAAIDAVNQETSSSQERSRKTQSEQPKPHRTRERTTREPSPCKTRPLIVTEMVQSEGEHRRRRPNQQQVAVVDIRKEQLAVPASCQRDCMDADRGVISASLTLKVPTKVHTSTVGAVALRMDDRDIPFIEDIDPDQELETTVRVRSHTGSEHKHYSYSSSIRQERIASQSQSSSNRGSGSTDSERSVRVRSGSGLRKPHHSQDSVLSSEGASSLSTGEVVSPLGSLRHTPSSDYGCPSSFSGTSTPQSTGSPTTWGWTHSTPPSPGTSPVQKRVLSPTHTEKRRQSNTSRRSSGGQSEWPQETWKRWEIISSEHTEQETLV